MGCIVSFISCLINKSAESHKPSDLEKLPSEMICEIYEYIDNKSLLKSRLVCKKLQNVIDNTPKLMKQITFNVVDLKAFVKSNLATNVKSIKFKSSWRTSEKGLEKFFTTIESNVEQVILNFHQEYMFDRVFEQKLLFSMILRNCTKLKSLKITTQDRDNSNFIKDCTEDPRNILVLSMIQNLSINVRLTYLEDIRQLLLSLPNLRRLVLICKNFRCNPQQDEVIRDEIKIYNMVMEHLSKYNGKLQEISFGNEEQQGFGISTQIVTKLFLTVGQLYPATNIKTKAYLLDLSKFVDTEEIQVNKDSCRAIQTGLLNIFEDLAVIDTSRTSFCSNLQSLEIIIGVNQQISSTKFKFVKDLKKLTYLNINGSSGFGYEPEDQLLCVNEAFSCGIPSLSTLDFSGGRFGLNSISFNQCFPNLTKLYIRRNSVELNLDLIYNLTKLYQLKYLTFEWIEELTDQHLTKLYDFTDQNNNNTRLVLPAIAGFKCLKQIHLASCSNLTDKSLKYGIEFSDTIEKVILTKPDEIWENIDDNKTKVFNKQITPNNFPWSLTCLELRDLYHSSSNLKFPNLSWSNCL